MRPIKTKRSNFVYLGPTDDIGDLHCRVEPTLEDGAADRKHQTAVYAVWELSDHDRAAIANGYNIELGIHTMMSIPPVSLIVIDAPEVE